LLPPPPTVNLLIVTGPDRVCRVCGVVSMVGWTNTEPRQHALQVAVDGDGCIGRRRDSREFFTRTQRALAGVELVVNLLVTALAVQRLVRTALRFVHGLLLRKTTYLVN
jgi:hypothetical protein